MILGKLFNLEIAERVSTALQRRDIDPDVQDVPTILSRPQGVPACRILGELAEPVCDVSLIRIALPTMEIRFAVQRID